MLREFHNVGCPPQGVEAVRVPIAVAAESVVRFPHCRPMPASAGVGSRRLAIDERALEVVMAPRQRSRTSSDVGRNQTLRKPPRRGGAADPQDRGLATLFPRGPSGLAVTPYDADSPPPEKLEPLRCCRPDRGCLQTAGSKSLWPL